MTILLLHILIALNQRGYHLEVLLKRLLITQVVAQRRFYDLVEFHVYLNLLA